VNNQTDRNWRTIIRNILSSVADGYRSFSNIAFVRFGLIGGVIALYLSMIGMVEAFDARNLVGTLFSTGDILIIAGPFAAGLLTARSIREKKPWIVLLYGLAAGALASVFQVALIFLESAMDLRFMFISVSPGLMEILKFGQEGLVAGSLILATVSGVMGLIGAGFFLLPSAISRAVSSGIIVTLLIGLLSDNVSQILNQFFERSFVNLLIQQKSLSPLVALILFIVVGGLTYLRAVLAKPREEIEADASTATRQRWFRIVMFILAIGLLLGAPWIVGRFLSQVLFMVGLYVMMGLGLNIVVGYAGLLDLGYVAFFAFGAYTMGVLTTTDSLGISNLNFWLALPVCALVGVITGFILGVPVLRMRGDYLAIVTLGFGEIIRILALSDWLAPLIGGAQGILHIPYPRIGEFEFNKPELMYYLVIVGSLLAGFLTVRLRQSRLGRQWMAMREDEDVAEAMGINLVQTKLLAFMIGAAFSALAGGIFAARLSTIFPHTFNLLWSINALSLIIVGGMGSIPGVVVGALILVGLPELLREFQEYRLLMYGLLLIVMMLVRPEGFIPEARRKQELRAHAEDAAAGAAAD
jgi:branched-chain amino acid transport system permease protein